MVYGLGPRALPAYDSLREQILQGHLLPGTKLQPHTELAVEYGIAPLTMRQVLRQLEEDGLVSREQGRGTFVQERTSPMVLIVEDDPEMRELISLQVGRLGYRTLTAEGPSAGLAALDENPAIGFMFSDIRMPTAEAGITFIRTVRRRWRDLPVAALTAYPDDLAQLLDTPECPVLILAKPARVRHIEEALQMVFRERTHPTAPAGRNRGRPVAPATNLITR